MSEVSPDIKFGELRFPSNLREWEDGASPVSKSLLDKDLGQKLRGYRDICQADLFRSAAQCFSFIWVMDEKCDVLVAYEEIVTGMPVVTGTGLLKNGHPRRRGFPSHPADEKKLGHPTLVDGGKARVAGELFLDVADGLLQWYVSCGSGRYCRVAPPDLDQQGQVHALFMHLIDDQVRFDRI